MLRYFFSRQFLGFLAAGGTAAVLHWLSRMLLSNWFSFPWAVALAYAVGMTVAFSLNSLFVFAKSTRPRHKQVRDFVAVNLAFFPVVWFVSLVLAEGLRSLGIERFSEAIAHGIAVVIPVLATFLFYKTVAFKDVDYAK